MAEGASPLKKRSVVSSFIIKYPTGSGDEAKPMVALFKRSDKVNTYKHHLAPISGGIETDDASPLAAAWRELLEETTLTPKTLELIRQGKSYTFSDPSVGREWTIYPFAYQLKAPDSAIQIDWEHEDWGWFDPTDVEDSAKFGGVPHLAESLRRAWFEKDLGGYPGSAGAILTNGLHRLGSDYQSGARELATTALSTLKDVVQALDMSELQPLQPMSSSSVDRWWALVRMAAWNIWKNGRESMGAAILSTLLGALGGIEDMLQNFRTQSDTVDLKLSSLRNAAVGELDRRLELRTSALSAQPVADALGQYLKQNFPAGSTLSILTLSESSTITQSLRCLLSRSHFASIEIRVLESRPLFEGVSLAATLVRHIRSETNQRGAEANITVYTDASAALAAHGVNIVLLGADRIASSGAVSNKTGSLPAVLSAKQPGSTSKVIVLGETEKIAPPGDPHQHVIENNEPTQLTRAWHDRSNSKRVQDAAGVLENAAASPSGLCAVEVQVQNIFFEWVPPELIDKYVTELGVWAVHDISQRSTLLNAEKDRIFGTGQTINGFGSARTIVLGLARILFASLPVASVSASPLPYLRRGVPNSLETDDRGDVEPESELWVLYLASAVLVLLGGAFAGLTIALMGQDSIYLQVLSRDETEPQQKNARRVYDLLQRGKHWVLVTLLLSNVIVNETLPVVLDRCLGGGVAAVVGSTLLIVVFGEVLPQSICVRYGLQIGGVMSKPVLALMWLMAPIAWPTAKVLDRALGEDHGTVYKKSGLKTLVTLHRSLGDVSQRLNQDEVTIISAVLDLKEKPVSSVMTPMEDVFTMSEDTVLDESTMDLILSAGYSRIPIHEPGNPSNFVGMLLVKILITYDPEDSKVVSEFPLATLPETRPETSCLDIVNFFQEGKSHMVLVSQYPGEDHGALGVVTLEDVIEELIGEEIIDESDVYIDVHKAIRRLQPAPRARPNRHLPLGGELGGSASANEATVVIGAGGNSNQLQQTPEQRASPAVDAQVLSTSPKATMFMLRRCSTGDGRMTQSTVPVRTNIDEVWQHLRHLGPSNRANNPKNTRSTTVKIKTAIAAPRIASTPGVRLNVNLLEGGQEHEEHDDEDYDETTHLLGPKHHTSDSDEARTSLQSYGTRGVVSGQEAASEDKEPSLTATVDTDSSQGKPAVGAELQRASSSDGGEIDVSDTAATESAGQSGSENAGHENGSGSGSATGVLISVSDHSTVISCRPIVRSGSITENIIETRGIRKVVLETNSSAEEDDGVRRHSGQQHHRDISLHSPTVADAVVLDANKGVSHGEEESEPGASSRPASKSPLAEVSKKDTSSSAAKKKTRRKKRKANK
ncbi:duf21 and cbs domain containing protein [Grosmannia clavigera kw1407]|uniref:Duf21 and cbs domain containing protein n=1 Tax=Grosmannia clavigera (strain kw1407 / UAMH 11150) TaxID=655863 RepID=F0X993_GROCL|nr:duf21 and cbs domain containing protein [Grosmannia clavigera kw1407]EFX05892.1 duf21 and cbs domain containing protein [Grosmannia clavigera kw1407]